MERMRMTLPTSLRLWLATLKVSCNTTKTTELLRYAIQQRWQELLRYAIQQRQQGCWGMHYNKSNRTVQVCSTAKQQSCWSMQYKTRAVEVYNKGNRAVEICNITELLKYAIQQRQQSCWCMQCNRQLSCWVMLPSALFSCCQIRWIWDTCSSMETWPFRFSINFFFYCRVQWMPTLPLTPYVA